MDPKNSTGLGGRLRAIRQLRRTYRNWVSLSLALLRGDRLPSIVLLRTGVDLGPPATRGRVFAFADAVARGWVIEEAERGAVTIRPVPGTSLRCRWDRGFDIENAVEVYGDRVYAAEVRDRVVIDVGASIGDSALFFASEGARRVIAFEPSPESFDLAARNIARSRIGGTIELLPDALGGAAGRQALRFPKDVPNASSLAPAPQAAARWTFDSEVTVLVRTLDEVVATVGGDRIGLLKVDCQGAEYELLGAASSETLRRIDAIVVEFTDGPRDLAGRLTGAGFDVAVDPGVRGYLRAVRPPPVVAPPSG